MRTPSPRNALPFVALLCLSPLFACSSVRTAWYSEAPEEFHYDIRTRERRAPSARLRHDGVEVQLWSYSGGIQTSNGPCLLPVFTAYSAPRFNRKWLELIFVVRPIRKVGAGRFRGRIAGDSFELELEDGRRVRPRSIGMFSEEPGMIRFMREFKGTPESIAFSHPVRLRLDFPNIRYAAVKSYTIRPRITLEQKKIAAPAIRFRPAKQRNIRWFYVPVPGVR